MDDTDPTSRAPAPLGHKAQGTVSYDTPALTALLSDSENAFGLELQEPWASMVMSGVKKVETRSYDLHPKLRNRSIYVIASHAATGGNPLCDRPKMGAGTVMGMVVFGEVKSYATEEAWEADGALHCVSAASPHAWRVHYKP
jgi:hypothetical protein